MSADKLRALTRESYDRMADVNSLMVERFNVSGAMVAKIFGRPPRRRRRLSPGRRPGCAISASRWASIRGSCSSGSALSRRSPCPSSTAGAASRRSEHTTLDVGHGGRSPFLPPAPLRPPDGALQPPGRRRGRRSSSLRAGLFGWMLDLKPMVTQAPGARALAPGPGRVEFDHVGFRYPTAGEVSARLPLSPSPY